jgi:membrane protease YdiL (CAAX protease family)
VIVYVALFYAVATIFLPLMLWLGEYFMGLTLTGLLAAIFANWLTLRIYVHRPLVDVGLWANRASAENLGWGLLGGIGAACVVLGPPLLIGAAHLVRLPEDPTAGMRLFVAAGLACGAIGEELLFRGYGFQALVAGLGPYATVVPVGVLFALAHTNNLAASWLSTAITAGFGVVFGYAYLRSRDLWLPVGLHFGWNFTLALFGVNISGNTIRVTGYEMSWTAGSLWSGGEYGPEASVLTIGVLGLLCVYLWKARIRRQNSPLTDPPVESAICEASPPLLS